MKWRLILAFTGLIALMLLAQDVPLASYLRRVESDRFLASLERDAFILGGASENLLSGETSNDTIDGLQQTIDLYEARDGARVVITEATGRVLVATDPTDERGDDFSNRPEIVSALAAQPATGERDSSRGRLLYVAVPVLSGARVVGAVRLTYPASVIDDRAADKTRGLLVVFVISLAGAVVAALFMANGISSPVARLRRSTERLADGDFSVRADPNDGPPEIRSLARTFNAMTERISGLVEQQRSFAGDASHQLRTPLTALRLQLERGAAMIDTDPEAARERIEAASAETERLQRLVEGLLMIARSGGVAPERVQVDVTAAVRERGEVWAPLAHERGLRLMVVAPDGLRAMAVANGLEQIIDNFIDNAIGVVPEDSVITVTALRLGEEVAVHVLDEGPGMDPQHLAHAFDRFWRAPDAPHGGSGIGLAVVQHLAALSGGRAELRNRSDRTGLDASVVLPTT